MNDFIALTNWQDALYALTRDGKLFKIGKNYLDEIMRLPSQ
jgi:hypothetical protein